MIEDHTEKTPLGFPVAQVGNYSKERIADMVSLIKTLADLKTPGDKTHLRQPIIEDLRKLGVHDIACVIKELGDNTTYQCTLVQLLRASGPKLQPPMRIWWRSKK